MSLPCLHCLGISCIASVWANGVFVLFSHSIILVWSIIIELSIPHIYMNMIMILHTTALNMSSSQMGLTLIDWVILEKIYYILTWSHYDYSDSYHYGWRHTKQADLSRSCWHGKYNHINGLVQDCSNAIANALELLQFCTKLSIFVYLDLSLLAEMVVPLQGMGSTHKDPFSGFGNCETTLSVLMLDLTNL